MVSLVSERMVFVNLPINKHVNFDLINMDCIRLTKT